MRLLRGAGDDGAAGRWLRVVRVTVWRRYLDALRAELRAAAAVLASMEGREPAASVTPSATGREASESVEW